MLTIQEIVARKEIIKLSSREDILILDENYVRMIKETANSDEREQLKGLRLFIQTRIDSHD